MNTNHALKLEDLDISEKKGDTIVEVLRDFLTNLNYNADQIDPLECRSRPGFMPYSNNKGGLAAIAYADSYRLPNGQTGFPNADATIETYIQDDIDSFAKENKLDAANYSNWTEEQYNKFDRYVEAVENTILYSTDLMLESPNLLNIRMCVCVKDAPYHRHYDDLLKYTIEFKTPSELKRLLNKLLKDKAVKLFADNVNDAY